MPLKKCKFLEEMENSCWMAPNDPRLWRQIAAVWQLSLRLAPRHYPPGVYKHRSIKDANRQSEIWEKEIVRKITV